MPTPDVRTLEVTIALPLDEAYRFLTDPANWPLWASGLGQGLERRGDAWTVRTPEGTAEVRFTPANPYGVLDHSVHFPDGRVVALPMRLIANGDASTLIFTLFRQPEMDDAHFAEDVEWVRRDLAKLREVLENRKARSEK